MAKVLQNKRKGYTVSLKIEASLDEVDAGLEAAFKRLVKSAKLPGFRKGKVPRNMFEKHYGKEILVQEGLPDVVNQAYASAIGELGLKVVDYPQNVDVAKYEESTPLSFTCEVDVEPEVKLGKYKGVKVTKEADTAKDEDVNAQINELRENYADYQVTDNASEDGDILLCNVSANIGGEAFEMWSRQNVGLKLGTAMFGADFDAKLVGVKKDHKASFSLSYDSEFHVPSVCDKTVDFEVEVVEVRGKSLPELDDAFAKKVGQVETYAELEGKIRENLDAQAKKNSEDKLRNDIMDEIVSNLKVDIPEGMVKQELDQTLNQFKQQIMQQTRMEFDQYLAAINKTEDELKEEWKDAAEKRVKSGLAITAIIEKEKLEAEDSELDAEIKAMNLPDMPDLATFMASPQAGNIDYLKDMVVKKKAMDFIVDSAKIK